jgi:hypothetical protein
MPANRRSGRQPVGRVIDSQSVKTTERGGPRGYDAGKKVTGRKRHIITETSGHGFGAQAHGANVEDHDGAPDLLASIRHLFPWLLPWLLPWLRHILPMAAMPVRS